ncbi:MAG: sensor histidine kinase [Planctomycetota bacterium]|jgi:PAS domain S-box-containing protein
MGVRGKLVLASISISLFIGIGPITYSLQEYRKAVVGQLQERGARLGERYAAKLGTLASRLGTVNDPVTISALKKEPAIISAHVLDTEGFIVTDGTKRDYGRERLPQLDLVLDQIRATSGFVTDMQGGIVNVSGPIMTGDKTAGYLHVMCSLDPADAIVGTLFRSVAAIFGALLITGSLLALALSHVFRQPIKWMVDGVEAIKKGNYKVEIPVRSKDELGRLADSINDVAASLRATTVSKRYLDEVLQSMADTLIVVDTDANIVTVNRATMEMLGYPENQLVGQPASLVCIDEGYQLTGARLHHLLGEQAQQDHEMMYRTSDGDLIPISFSGSPIRDNTGEVVGYVCIGKDITDRKRAEVERERLNQKLVETSRQAGMAEVATGVLHNVGNVLNSVNVSASVVAETVKKSKVNGLTKATELIKANQSDVAAFISGDEKGKQLPGYICKVTDHLIAEQQSILGELDSLTNNINHIKEIISMQQSYSKVTGVLESVDLSELVDEALRLNAVALERHCIQIKREVDYVPATKTDRHKVLQVLVNLVTNAKDAMLEQEDNRVLAIALRKNADNGEFVSISVTDKGVGIHPDNMRRIFTHGFTTKEKGHGFGLHSAALTAKELGGSLVANSDGPGTGATFTLSLPLRVAEVKR